MTQPASAAELRQLVRLHGPDNIAAALDAVVSPTLSTLHEEEARDFVRRDYVETTPLGKLRTELNEHFKAHEGDWGFEGFSGVYEWTQVMPKRVKDQPTLTDDTKLADIRYRWIVCYAVTGGNEGHYVHADIIAQHDYSETRTPLFLTKTFSGQEAAIQIAAELTRVLGA